MFVLDAGDAFGNQATVSSLEAMLKSEFLLRGMDLCGYDAMNLGNDEFMFGEIFLADQLAERDLTATSANIIRQDDDSPYAAPHVTLTKGDRTVGVIGLLDEEFATEIETASAFEGDDVTMKGLVSSLAAARAELGEVNVTVVLLHQSFSAARDLAQAGTGVDIIVAGHDRLAPPAAEEHGETLLLGAGYDGKWVVKLDVNLDAGGSMASYLTQTIALNTSFPDDPTLAALYDEYLERVETEAESIIDSIPQEDPPTGGSYVGSDTCIACHEPEATQWALSKHATAFDTLVELQHDYQPSCFPCHSTGFGFKGGFLLPNHTPAMKHVGCESCHGAGAEHSALPEVGWGVVDTPGACIGCHNADNSPQFDLETYLPAVQHSSP